MHACTVTNAQAGVGWEVHAGDEDAHFFLDLPFFSPVHTSFQHNPAHSPLAHCQQSTATPASRTRCTSPFPAPAREVRQHPQMFCVYPFICVFLLNLLMCFVLHESVLWGYHAPCSFPLCTVALRSILLPPPLVVPQLPCCAPDLSLHR